MSIAIGSGSGVSSITSSITGNRTQNIMEESYVDENQTERYYEEEYYADEYLDDYEDPVTEGPMSVLEESLPPFVIKILAAITLMIILIFIVIAVIIQIFVLGPLEVGGCNYFKNNVNDNVELNTIAIAFKKKYYWKMVSAMFLRKLYIVLWSLLLFVPGIIKAYEYRMVPFILADAPKITRKDAFRINKEMMRGNKWRTFILDLSFIGWQMLSTITCGIAGIFYVNPYQFATNAELFVALREEYFHQRG